MNRAYWFTLIVAAAVGLGYTQTAAGQDAAPAAQGPAAATLPAEPATAEAADHAPLDLGFNLDDYCMKSWYGVYINGKKSGYAVAEIARITHNERPAYRVSMAMTLTVSMMGQSQTVEQKEYQVFYATGEMAECFSSLGEQSYRGVVAGDTITITARTGGEEKTRTQPAPGVTLVDEVAPLKLVLSNPKPGDSVTAPSYDPMVGVLTTTTVVKGSRTVTRNGADTLVYTLETTVA